MATLTVPRMRRMVVAMKVEGTYGTDVFAGTYTAADIIPCFNISPAITLEEIENLALSGDIVQENGSTLKMAGCFGDVDFTMRAGGIITARFAFQGMLVGEADVSFVAGTIAGTPAYPTVKSPALQIHTHNYAPRIATIR